MYAFEVTVDDVINVFIRNGRPVSDSVAMDILDDLALELVEEAALQGENLEEQTEYAYQEIERQLFDKS